MSVVIYIRNKKRWKQQEDSFYVGRPSPLSNPFIITESQTRAICIERYTSMLISAIQQNDPRIISALQKIESHLKIHGKVNLVCWCSPEPCHADVIRNILLNKFHTGEWLVNGEI